MIVCRSRASKALLGVLVWLILVHAVPERETEKAELRKDIMDKREP